MSERRLDRTDHRSRRLQADFLFTGLELPAPAVVRERLTRRLAEDDRHRFGRTVDVVHGRYAVVPSRDRSAWAGRVVVPATGPPPDAHHLIGSQPELDDLPARILVGPDWTALRMSHAVLDGWTALTLLADLVAREPAPPGVRPATEVPAWRRDLGAVLDVGRRPGVLAGAARSRGALAGGPYEVAAHGSSAPRHRTAYRASGPGFADHLRQVRDRRWPGASLGSVVLVGLRRALSDRLPAPRAGAEVIYDVRGSAAHPRTAAGNWSAGVYVTPEDDGSPASVSRAIADVRRRGLPVIALAATRLPRPRADVPHRLAARTGRPRLALSHYGSRSPVQDLPWTGAATAAVAAASTPPNGIEAITINTMEVAGRCHLSLCHYEDGWPAAAVDAALDAFVDEPLRWLPGTSSAAVS